LACFADLIISGIDKRIETRKNIFGSKSVIFYTSMLNFHIYFPVKSLIFSFSTSEKELISQGAYFISSFSITN